jgi:hypothetical protein
VCVSLKSIGQQIKILERLQHISDDGRTDGRPAFPYPPPRFAGEGDKNSPWIRQAYKIQIPSETVKSIDT